MRHLIYLFIMLGLLMGAQSASAQPITAYSLGVYNVANPTTPVTSWVAPISTWECNLPAPPAGPSVVANPRYVYTDDVDNAIAGRWCRLDLQAPPPPGGPLVALPWSGTATYELRAARENSAGVGPAATATERFTKPGTVRAAPAQLRLTSGS